MPFTPDTFVTLDEIKARVAAAFARHPLCRHVGYEIVTLPPSTRGNWTVVMTEVEADAIWEASEIVSDIRDAYPVAIAA